MKCYFAHLRQTKNRAIPALVCAAVLAASGALAQAVDYEEAPQRTADIGNRTIVDAPTSYTLPRGAFDIDFTVYSNGGLIAASNIGLSNYLMIGVSYGADAVFAQEDPAYNPAIEFNVKWRLTEESPTMPGLALGFSSQGNGAYLSDYGRYTYKSKGFYGVMSKAISITGYAWTFHAGANYSTEREQNVGRDKTPNLYGGLTTALRQNLSMAWEYDFALNDNKGVAPYGKGRGYLNAAIKWVYFDNLQLEFTLRNLLENRREAESFERGFKIVYLEYF